MGVRVLEDRDGGGAVLYCSTSGWAFGPVMTSADEAEGFLHSLPSDARSLSEADLRKHYSEFVLTSVCECGEVRVTTCTWCKNGLYPAAVDGKHTNDYDPTDTVECELEPEPPAGERYECSYCKKEMK